MSDNLKCSSEDFCKLPGFIWAELIGGKIHTDDWTALEVDKAVFENEPSERKRVTYRLSVVKVEDVPQE